MEKPASSSGPDLPLAKLYMGPIGVGEKARLRRLLRIQRICTVGAFLNQTSTSERLNLLYREMCQSIHSKEWELLLQQIYVIRRFARLSLLHGIGHGFARLLLAWKPEVVLEDIAECNPETLWAALKEQKHA